MARSHLTLAALATSAVPGLDVVQARKHSQGAHGLFDSALIIGSDGRALIVRVPVSQSAETEQSADLVALRALTVGNRSRLPFDVPEFVGQAPAGHTRAVVYELLTGDSFDADALTGHVGVSGSIGRSIAAIHSLPTSFVAEAGIAQHSAQDCRTSTIDLIDRAAATGHLPAALLRRWELATDDDALWQFQPTVIHGSLTADSLLISDDAVSGVLGWSELAVGDPAQDLQWLLAARGEASETALSVYTQARQGSDHRIAQRAMLYAELELARWLLHGTDTKNQTIIDDAIDMLDGLVDTVHSHTTHPLNPTTGPALEVSDIEAMLAQTPRTAATHESTGSMHTDPYEVSDPDDSRFIPSDFSDSEFAPQPPAETAAYTDAELRDALGDAGADTALRTDDQASRRSSSE